MKRLRKLLDKSSKVRRWQRNLLNMQMTILAWMAEFLGFFVIFLGSFILGHENIVVTLSLQILTTLIIFILCPSVYLMNSSKVKDMILENHYYITMINKFNCRNFNNEVENDDEGAASEHENDP